MPTDPPPTDPWDIMLRVINEDATTARLRANLECLRVAIETERAAERQQATAQQAKLEAERDHERHEKQTVADAWQGYVTWATPLRAQIAVLESRLAAKEAEVASLTADNERLRGALDTQLRITTEHWQVIETQRQELERLQRPWRSRVEHAEGVAFLVADAVDPREADSARLTAQQEKERLEHAEQCGALHSLRDQYQRQLALAGQRAAEREAEVASLTKQVETATKAHSWLTSEPIDKLQRIETRCPSCGNTTLFVGSGGHLTCSWLKCNEPGVERAVEKFRANVAAKDAEVASLTQQLAEARQEMSAAHDALNEAGAPDKEAVPDFTRGEGHYLARRLGLAQRIHRITQQRVKP